MPTETARIHTLRPTAALAGRILPFDQHARRKNHSEDRDVSHKEVEHCSDCPQIMEEFCWCELVLCLFVCVSVCVPVVGRGTSLPNDSCPQMFWNPVVWTPNVMEFSNLTEQDDSKPEIWGVLTPTVLRCVA